MAIQDSKKLSESSRNQLLASAASLFGKKGYYGTTIDDITANIGITRGALYWHFKSKSDILTGVLELINTVYLDRIIAKIELITTGPMDKLWHMFKFNAKFAIEYPSIIDCLRTLSLEILSTEDKNKNILLNILDRQRFFINNIVKEGQEVGIFRKDFTSDMITAIILAIHDGIILQYKIYNPSLNGRDLAWAFKQITFAGILSDAKIINP